VPQTDAIFAHVQQARVETAADPDTLRISIDTKAKVKVGDFSRGGEARGGEAVKALDHDMAPEAVLVPFGVLELNRGAVPIHQPWFLFGHSRETSDFLADGLDQWWQERKTLHTGVQRLHIELDNGPEIGSSRTQFLKRMVEFVDRHQVAVELVYLPPYHSKYNPIERCWGILERHWNGALLGSVTDVLRWAGTMTWRGLRPIIRETTTIYERGVRLTKAALRPIAQRLTRSPTLPKWSLTIQPNESGG
jgi:Rhodopirellula transposase DDE domain